MSITGKAAAKKILRGQLSGCELLYMDAYELAVQHGFEGTIEEWLESIKGAPGEKGDNGKTPVRGVDYWTEDDKRHILDEANAGKVLYTQQDLTDIQKTQARANIGAASLDQVVRCDCPQKLSDVKKIRARYNIDAAAEKDVVKITGQNLSEEQQATARRNIGAIGVDEIPKSKEKVYEHIATITVTPDADGSLPQHVIFTADSEGNPFELTDFMVKAYAGFVDGSASSLNVAVNKSTAISGSAIPSISTTLRGFNIFFRQENDHFVRAEHTVSVGNANVYNPAGRIAISFLVPTMSVSEYGYMPVSKIDLYTNAGTSKAWVEGSTFELWGVRV